MNTTRERVRQLMAITAAAVTLMFVAVAPAGADTADALEVTPGADRLPAVGETFAPDDIGTSDTRCTRDWCFQTIRDDASDEGGYWAQSIMWSTADESDAYRTTFLPGGETLYLMDRVSDGFEARADVNVTSPGDVVLDHDTFFTGYDGKYNLGTPDGSGDIAEGNNVWIRVCVGRTTLCADWVQGVA